MARGVIATQAEILRRLQYLAYHVEKRVSGLLDLVQHRPERSIFSSRRCNRTVTYAVIVAASALLTVTKCNPAGWHVDTGGVPADGPRRDGVVRRIVRLAIVGAVELGTSDRSGRT